MVDWLHVIEQFQLLEICLSRINHSAFREIVPRGPLNWSRRRKLLSVTCMAVYMVMVGLSCSLVYSIIVPVAENTGLSVADLNAGTGYNYLAFGWGCLIWHPAAKQFGKRPIYLISLLLSIGATIAVPHVLSPGSWMATKILGGLAGGPLECLGEISIADVFCAHERGKFMAIYAFVLFAAGFLAPILAGFINDGMGWRWAQYWGAIWLAIGFLFCFFFMEETNFTRTSILVTEETQNEIGSKTAAYDAANGMDDTKSENVQPILRIIGRHRNEHDIAVAGMFRVRDVLDIY